MPEQVARRFRDDAAHLFRLIVARHSDSSDHRSQIAGPHRLLSFFAARGSARNVGRTNRSGLARAGVAIHNSLRTRLGSRFILINRHDVAAVKALWRFCAIELNTKTVRVTGHTENRSGSNSQFRAALSPQAGQLNPAARFHLEFVECRLRARQFSAGIPHRRFPSAASLIRHFNAKPRHTHPTTKLARRSFCGRTTSGC